jgi:RNA polymerase sigma factor (sigma-70 family)
VKGLEEQNLWLKFKDGDKEALSFLYEQYIHMLFSYGMKIHQNEFLVKDCIQEVFIQLIEKRRDIKITYHTHLYLFKSLRNKLLEELRSKKRKADISRTNIQQTDLFEDSFEQSIILSEEDRYRRKLVKAALNILNDYQKEAIFLRYSQGFSYDEMAEMLDIDISSARTLVYRSLKKIKEALSQKIPIFFYLFRLIRHL